MPDRMCAAVFSDGVVDKLTGSNLASMIGMALFHPNAPARSGSARAHAGDYFVFLRWWNISGTYV